MQLSDIEIKRLMIDTAEMAAKKALIEVGQLKPYLTLKEAQRIHGEYTVNRWINEGLLKPIKDGARNCKVRIDRIQLDAVAATSNRASWYKHNMTE
ncbi:hypothetical protein LX69_01106 [Breznakibacter xylanolyticus]|uniref:Uncharacterized protein n=1 Tax=Breznakibacter xylanolyticus TaxID=990 RepID=A0A2W7NDQ5_9BACT|nr:DNA-binding protein [Breznakibacter xylanolyticus]PZX18070.1 hypothetical protein LX69_01106 [Breznakibacter xylanolyticus]